MSFLDDLTTSLDGLDVERFGSSTIPTIGVWNDRVDRYSGFSHRAAEGHYSSLAVPPWWIRDAENRRRSVSYNVAKAYQETVARFFHEREGADSDYYQNREHGHAEVLISRTAEGIVGEGPDVVVDGAEEELPPSPVLPDRPEITDESDPTEQAAHAAAMAFYREQGRRAIAAWTEQVNRHQRLVELQAWLRNWATSTSFWRKLAWTEQEHTVVKGDGVFVLGLDSKRRPSVQEFAPDAFFKPVDPSARTAESDFPDRVHLVWEYEEPRVPLQLPRRWVRRITYELLPVSQAWVPEYGDEPTRVRCFWSDARWETTSGRMSKVMQESDFDSFPLDEAQFFPTQNPFDPDETVEANRIPLPIDFIPVVHFKHTPGGNYGRSELARRIGLIDDMIAGDTAAALVSILCGEPPISIKDGHPAADIEFGPAAAIAGDATKIGFSHELIAVVEYQNLLERQFVKVTGLSSELAGRENREQSGRAIGLKMTPYRQLVLRGRLARDDQHDLLWKFVQRLAIIGQPDGFPMGPVESVHTRWGTFIPEDQSELVEQIIALRDRGLLTNEDVYDWLIAAGFDFRNPAASLDFLRSIDVKTARELAEIVGHSEAARYLGRNLDEDTTIVNGNSISLAGLAELEDEPPAPAPTPFAGPPARGQGQPPATP